MRNELPMRRTHARVASALGIVLVVGTVYAVLRWPDASAGIVIALIGSLLVFFATMHTLRAQLHQQAMRAWGDAAKRLGVGHHPTKLLLEGDVNGCAVRFELHVETPGAGMRTVECRARVGHKTHRPPLTVQRAGWLGGGERIETGDSEFDRTWRVEGPPLAARAAFGAASRAAFDAVAAEGVTMQHGVLSRTTTAIPESAEEIVSLVQRMVACATTTAFDDAHAAVAGNALEDLHGGVRRLCFDLLVRAEPEHPATRRMIDTAFAQRERLDLHVRAAWALGPSGASALAAVARDPGADTGWRSQALLWLAESDVEAAIPVVAGLLVEDEEPLLDGVLGACVDIADIRLAPALRHYLAARSVTGMAVKALGVCGDATDEPWLVDRIDDPDHLVAVAAVRALGRLGSRASVEPLMRISSGGVTDVLHRRRAAVAREALDAIRERLGGAEAGGLAVVDASGGELAVSQHDEQEVATANR